MANLILNWLKLVGISVVSALVVAIYLTFRPIEIALLDTFVLMTAALIPIAVFVGFVFTIFSPFDDFRTSRGWPEISGLIFIFFVLAIIALFASAVWNLSGAEGITFI